MNKYETSETVRIVRTVPGTEYEMYGVSSTPYIRTPAGHIGFKDNTCPLLEYRRLALLHRPTEGSKLAAEVLRLSESGLTPVDVSQALGVPLTFAIEVVSRGSTP